jgi:hypothetical protein
MSKWIVKSEDGQWYLERRPRRDVITSRQKEATRFASKEEAIEAAGKEGRAIRLVGYAEQLRKAKERIEELEQAITTTDERAYQTGRAEERAAVVQWLPGAPPRSSWGYAKDIEEGVHVR